MHELPITKSIFKTVISKAESIDAEAVTKVVLEIGILRDFIPEMVQKYWDYISKGSLADGSVIEIREVDAIALCGECGRAYPIDRENIGTSCCPDCGCKYGKLVSGSELRIVGIEVKRKHIQDGTLQRPGEKD